MSSLRSRVNAELLALAEQHGTLKQQHVVDAAKETGSALHEDFEKQGLWDDAIAAQRARLEYAGRLIRFYVVVREDQKAPVRALVSLSEDRKAKSGLPGYRKIDDVLDDDSLRENLIQTVLMELRAVRRKYEHLKELTAVWSAIETVDQQHAHPRRPDDREERVSA